MPGKNNSGEEWLVWALSLGIQLIVVGSAWWQECEAEDHSAPATRRQREVNASLSSVLHLLLVWNLRA